MKLSVATMTLNIKRVYWMATADEIEDGLEWYPEALDECYWLGIHYNIPTWKAAAVVAAMSPQKAWKHNIDAAGHFLRQHRDGISHADMSPKPNTKAQCDKAAKCLEAKTPDACHTIIKGKAGYKTASFFLNLIGNETVVTVDRHAIRIATADDSLSVVKPNEYMPCSEAYCLAAEELGLRPSQLQAITWVTYRRLHNIK